jgi:hypothetical protein
MVKHLVMGAKRLPFPMYHTRRILKLFFIFFRGSAIPTAVLSGSIHGPISALKAAGTIIVAVFACSIVDLSGSSTNSTPQRI